MLEYQPIYLILPKIASSFADRVRQQIRGYAWAKIIEIPLKYSHNHPSILARNIGLKSADGPVWSIRTEGVLAVDRALTLEKPCTVRIVSVGGPGVTTPTHIKTMTGYPMEAIRKMCLPDQPVRMIAGGMLTGTTIGDDAMGLATECLGVTVLKEHTEREFLGFMRLGLDRKSYAPCFFSAMRTKFSEALDTAVYGEDRPCIACNFCEEVCPAGIMPHLIHKYLYRDLLEEVDQARVDLCVQCGLCSFVCPSKIELRQQFADALGLIAEEKEQIRLEELKQQKLREEEEQRKLENKQESS
jgi:Na+-transporting NADH:ubiquinone oxidoreductase subunit A